MAIRREMILMNVGEKILPLKVEELYVIEDSPEREPSSIHVVAVRKDAIVNGDYSVV